MAEGVGVEPTRPVRVTAFQAVALGHYATPPRLKRRLAISNIIFTFYSGRPDIILAITGCLA